MLEEEKGVLVDHLTLKDPLEVQSLHLTGMRGRGIIGIIHVINLRMQGRLPLMAS